MSAQNKINMITPQDKAEAEAYADGQPANEYGWLTARSPQEIVALGKPQSGDQIAYTDGWSTLHDPTGGYSQIGDPIRRRVNPNSDQPPGQEPFELVPEAEAKQLQIQEAKRGGFEITTDGKSWSIPKLEWVGDYPEILAVRRRKRVAKPFPFTGQLCKTCHLPFTHAPGCPDAEPVFDPATDKPEVAIKPEFTPSELDEAARVLGFLKDPYTFDGLFGIFQEGARRHLAVVKNLQALSDNAEKTVQELQRQVKHYEAIGHPCWHPLTPASMPRVGQPFEAFRWEGSKPICCPQPLGVDDPWGWLEEHPLFTHWTPLPPLPAQKSEAEECYQALPNGIHNALDVIKFALDWAKKGKV